MESDSIPPPVPPVPGGGPRSLATQGDVASVAAWSGTYYSLYQAARRAGFVTHALDTTDPAYRRRRLRWNALAPLRLERPGGYQYSRIAARRTWERIPAALRRGEMIGNFQTFPPLPEARRDGVTFSWYGDATLRQLFDEQGQGKGIGRRTAADAVAREREMYHAARFVLPMATETARWLVRDYGVNPGKVFVVRAGANLDDAAVRQYLATRGPSWREGVPAFTPDHPARLGFIGRDYRRKGLPRLVAAAETLARRGRPVRVTVIGDCPEHLRGHPQVEWVGVLSKAADLGRFLAAIDRFALGCLPSYHEPLGISTLEALRLGVPVLGTNVGGIPDCVPTEGGILLPADVTGEQIADALEAELFDPARYQQLVAGAKSEMTAVGWDRTVRRLVDVWEGRGRSFAEISP